MPFINIVPAFVWSIPLHQKLYPDASFWVTFGIGLAFMIAYLIVSLLPIIVVVPNIASTIIYTGLFWVFADHIGNDVARIIVKVLILAFVLFVEFALCINATLPWLQNRDNKMPRIIRVEE